MLVDITSGKQITYIPYRESFDRVRSELTASEFEQIVERINELIESSGGEIVTSSWLPGSDWTGTPFWPIYEKAARYNHDLAAKMFGLVVWHTIIKRPERWGSGRYEKDGRELSGRSYFVLGK